MQKEYLENKIKQVEVEVNNGELLIGFYKWLAEAEEDKTKKAEWKVKADQLAETKKFNEKFLEYAKTL